VLSLLFIYPLGVRNVGLRSRSNAVVNPEGVVKQRIRQLWGRFPGSGSNRDGCVRSPFAVCRNGEYGRTGGMALKGWAGARYRKTAQALALGTVG